MKISPMPQAHHKNVFDRHSSGCMHVTVWRSCFQQASSARQTPAYFCVATHRPIGSTRRTDRTGTGAPAWLGKGAAIVTPIFLWIGALRSVRFEGVGVVWVKGGGGYALPGER